jgi:hypothetical protein
VADGLCEPMQADCGLLERQAIDFSIAMGGTTRVFDQSVELTDLLAYGYWYAVQTATRYPDGVAVCDDVPNHWYQLAAIWFPSD